MRRILLLLLLLLIQVSPSGIPPIHAQAPLAFPGAQGDGATTTGGRGGKIIRVTSLENTGPGSLREAVRAKGPRIIVFEVGGVIDLKKTTLVISEPHVTIAGQTAPAPGITLIRGSMVVSTGDVIIRHLAVRPGEAGHEKKSGWNADGITTVGARNVIFDHLSCTWATDENLSTSGARFEGSTPEDWRKNTSHHITISNCIIAEGLSKSTHDKGEHSKGTLIHDNTSHISVIGNLYASNVERNPLAKGGAQAAIVNNWISNPARNAIHAALVDSEWKGHEHQPAKLDIVGNVLEHGADTLKYVSLFGFYEGTPVQVHMQNNLAFDLEGKPARLTRGEKFTLEKAPLSWPANLEAMPAGKVREHVAKNAGSRPWDRDPIDTRIIDAALNRKGKIINSEQEVGGYPEVKQAVTQTFNEAEWNLETMERVK
jgi:pectate lyase